MIPMKMKIGNNQGVVINKMFQASEIAPLAIQPDENDPNKKIYKLLFKLNEHITESDVFFEIRLSAGDDLDKSYIKARSLYIDNLKKDSNRYNAFKTIMKGFNPNIFYIGDFYFEFNNGNYFVDGFKQLVDMNSGRTYYEMIRIYIPRWMLIAIVLYMQDLTDPYNRVEKEYLFASNEISNMKFEKVENLEILGTCKTKKDQYFSYNTMYELSTGPSTWRFTYEILTEEDLEVKKPLDEELFEAWYSKYNGNFIGSLKEPNNMYNFVIIKDEYKKVTALIVKDEFINKTNLLDPYKIFVSEEDDKLEEEDQTTIIAESAFINSGSAYAEDSEIENEEVTNKEDEKVNR